MKSLLTRGLTFVIKSKQSECAFALLSSKNIQGTWLGGHGRKQLSLSRAEEADLKALNDKQGSVFDEIVTTIDGDKVGTVVDYHIDEKNEIGYLVVNSEDASEEQIPKSRILMIGKEYIILTWKRQLPHLEADVEMGTSGCSRSAHETEAAKPAEKLRSSCWSTCIRASCRWKSRCKRRSCDIWQEPWLL